MPIATTDVHGQEGGKIYCPRCKEIYAPRNQSLMQVDGSFFGTSFAPFFFLVNSHLVPPAPPKPYIPRIYGFRVHPSVRVFGRAQQYKEKEEEERRQKELEYGFFFKNLKRLVILSNFASYKFVDFSKIVIMLI